MTVPLAAVGYQRLIRPARGEAPDPEAVRKGIEEWACFSGVLERHLADHEWLAGQLTIADIAVGVWIELADRAGMLDEGSPTVAWLRALQNKPWWRAAGGYRLIGERSWSSS